MIHLSSTTATKITAHSHSLPTLGEDSDFQLGPGAPPVVYIGVKKNGGSQLQVELYENVSDFEEVKNTNVGLALPIKVGS